MIEAAGGVLWRARPDGTPEVAVVHRPKYDDWSLPKGKLDPGEHPLLAGLREVREEAGAEAVPGRPLGESHYSKDGLPKRVRWWAMQWSAGDFTPGPEVDQLVWLPAADAADRLLPDRDRPIVAAFLADPRPTVPVVVVRHASAGDRDEWDDEDGKRPLDDLGRRQADALVAVIGAYRAQTVVSSTARRCTETIEPYAAAHGAHVALEPLFTEEGYAADPEGTRRRAAEIAAVAGATVICGHRRSLPGVMAGLADGAWHPGGPVLPKAGLLVVHRAIGADGAAGRGEPVALEMLPPPYA